MSKATATPLTTGPADTAERTLLDRSSSNDLRTLKQTMIPSSASLLERTPIIADKLIPSHGLTKVIKHPCSNAS